MNNNSEHNNEELKKLFEKRKEELDDFEREAMEGYAKLGSKEDVLFIKADLDKKMWNIFLNKKNKNQFIWYAAATLFLTFTFGYLLVKKNVIPEKNELALITKNKEKKQELPAINERISGEIISDKTINPISNSGIEINRKSKKQRIVEPMRQNKRNLASTVQSESDKEFPNGSQIKNEDVVTSNGAPESASASSEEINSTIQETSAPAIVTYESKTSVINAPASKKGKSNEKRIMSGGIPLNEIVDCKYKNGINQFKKDLRDKLRKENLNVQLKGKLFVNAKLEITKTEWKCEENISDSEKEKIELILKSFNDFTLPSSNREVLFEFKFE